MKRKLLYTLLSVAIILAISLTWFFWPAKKISLQTTSFSALEGWENTDLLNSFNAFTISCRAFTKQNPEKSVGSEYIDLQVKDWLPACKVAATVNSHDQKQVKVFFEEHFVPVAFHDKKPVEGLFTGYYLPLLKGSLKKTPEFQIPLYGAPENLITVDLGLFDPFLKHHRKIKGRLAGKSLVPYYTRKEIKAGAINKQAPVIAWINNDVDRQFLEIEGSGIVELEDGSQLHIGYANENGAPYTSIASILIKMGVMTRDNASMQRIRTYFKKHPEKVEQVLNQNKSFVFFHILKEKSALGTQGVPLTPGYSLAVDRKWIPLGAPIWLSTTTPSKNHAEQASFKRLMVAQDTGGAIKGAVRGDVYWGGGEDATYVAGHMKNRGYYWLLLPRHTLPRVKDTSIAYNKATVKN